MFGLLLQACFCFQGSCASFFFCEISTKHERISISSLLLRQLQAKRSIFPLPSLSPAMLSSSSSLGDPEVHPSQIRYRSPAGKGSGCTTGSLPSWTRHRGDIVKTDASNPPRLAPPRRRSSAAFTLNSFQMSCIPSNYLRDCVSSLAAD